MRYSSSFAPQFKCLSKTCFFCAFLIHCGSGHMYAPRPVLFASGKTALFALSYVIRISSFFGRRVRQATHILRGICVILSPVFVILQHLCLFSSLSALRQVLHSVRTYLSQEKADIRELLPLHSFLLRLYHRL